MRRSPRRDRTLPPLVAVLVGVIGGIGSGTRWYRTLFLEEINRDYVRAIIRTPSMIYRFLRGIEAMKLMN